MSPLEFEITRVDCIYIKSYILQGREPTYLFCFFFVVLNKSMLPPVGVSNQSTDSPSG